MVCRAKKINVEMQVIVADDILQFLFIFAETIMFDI